MQLGMPCSSLPHPSPANVSMPCCKWKYPAPKRELPTSLSTVLKPGGRSSTRPILPPFPRLPIDTNAQHHPNQDRSLNPCACSPAGPELLSVPLAAIIARLCSCSSKLKARCGPVGGFHSDRRRWASEADFSVVGETGAASCAARSAE